MCKATFKGVAKQYLLYTYIQALYLYTLTCIRTRWLIFPYVYTLANLRMCLAVGEGPAGPVQGDLQRRGQSVTYVHVYTSWSNLCLRIRCLAYVYVG